MCKALCAGDTKISKDTISAAEGCAYSSTVCPCRLLTFQGSLTVSPIANSM